MAGLVSGPTLFLSVEAYRQVFWPYRRQILRERHNAAVLRLQLGRVEKKLSRIQAALALQERRNGDIILEQRHLAKMAECFVRSHDTAFYSAERLRWERECESMGIEELETTLDMTNKAIARMPQSDPRRATLTLHAAIIRLDVQDRRLGVLAHGSLKEAMEVRLSTEDALGVLQRRLQIVQDKMIHAATTIQHLRSTKPIVH